MIFLFLEKKKQKSASVDFDEEEKNNQLLSDQKETSGRRAAGLRDGPGLVPAPGPDAARARCARHGQSQFNLSSLS